MVLPAPRFRAAKQFASFARQRMNKSGQSSGGNPVPNWTSDATYPATISSHKLVVVGSGTVTVSVSVTANSFFGGETINLYRNNTSIGSVSVPAGTNLRTITVTGVSVSAGDLIHVGQSAGSRIASGYVEIIPG